MKNIKELLKRSFELFVKERKLKEIDRAVDRYNKAKARAAYERYVITVLLEKYKNKYGEDLRCGKYGNDTVAKKVVYGVWTNNGKNIHGQNITQCSVCHSNAIEGGRFCRCCGAPMKN